MSMLNLLLLLQEKGKERAQTALRALHGRASATLNLTELSAWPVAVKLMTGPAGVSAHADCHSGALKKIGCSSPDAASLRLGPLDRRALTDGGYEVFVQVLPSDDLSEIEARCAREFGFSAGHSCIVLGSTRQRIAPKAMANLQSWWEDTWLSPPEGLTVSCDTLATSTSNAIIHRCKLGRSEAVKRGLESLNKGPQLPSSSRARSCLPRRSPSPEPQLRRAPSLDSAKVDGHRNLDRPLARLRCTRLDRDTWAVGMSLAPEHPRLLHRPSTRFHFVLDNSGSMGRNTAFARDCFSELVASANGPCSLTVFNGEATTLGESFTTPAAMRAVTLPSQGQTNISEGVEKAVDIIRRCEADEGGRGSTHHVLVLLSDGQHNRGPRPEERLPELGVDLRASALRLSVVVVGVTGQSNTSMGMLLKGSLETISLPSLDPIYFARTMAEMGDVLGQMREGLASLKGGLVSVSPVGYSQGDFGIVKVVGELPEPSISLLASESEYPLLCVSSRQPRAFDIDGVLVQCTGPSSDSAAEFDSALAASALEALMDGVRQRRIATGAASVSWALEQLSKWTSAMETQLSKQQAIGGGFCLARADPRGRVAQHRAAVRALHGARELQNQLADIQALNTNDSASQAAFLTGARNKYGAKALRRAAADGPEVDQLESLLSDVRKLAKKMRKALREDLCAKLVTLSSEARDEYRDSLAAAAPKVSREVIDEFCFGTSGLGASVEDLGKTDELAKLADGGLAARLLWTACGCRSQSYLSLQTSWEQLSEWCDAASDAPSDCKNEYELLMYLGALGYPIDVERRAATQMNPFAMDVTRVRASVADSASLCCALRSEQPVVPPEGGVAVQDLLILVDPDLPRSSRLAASSKLLGEVYTSVVLCRDLHMYTGRAMRIALHAHSFLSAAQPAAPVESKTDLEAQLRRQYLGRAFQCFQCNFGPIDHYACGDLESHHGESDGRSVVNNACPRCNWFSAEIRDWPAWDGSIPAEALKEPRKTLQNNTAVTSGMAEIALRICYSARSLWRPDADGDAQALVNKLTSWEPLTAADGVDHPIQILLALGICDDVSEDAFEVPSLLQLLNEVCARRARDELRMLANGQESMVAQRSRERVASFMRIDETSAPDAGPVDMPEPLLEAVRESCSKEYCLSSSSFDFKAWVSDTLRRWVGALALIRRLRGVLRSRAGGWQQLVIDMETGMSAYADVVEAVCAKPDESERCLGYWIGVNKENLKRVCATMAAQAFLHSSSTLRRLKSAGGSLDEPLGDVRDTSTLEDMAVDLRMTVYQERVSAKLQEWHRVGKDITITRARACDLSQYIHLCGTDVHKLNKEVFWGLWKAAQSDKQNGDKVREFLMRANRDFFFKHGFEAYARLALPTNPRLEDE